MDLLDNELDKTALDILRAFWGDLGLEWHAVEGKVVDSEGELIRKDLVAQRQLPHHFGGLDPYREQSRVCEFLSPRTSSLTLWCWSCISLRSLKNVNASDNVPLIVKDLVEP